MRRQCAHGTNATGATRSPEGSMVWATDWTTPPRDVRPLREERVEVDLAKKRCGLLAAPPAARSDDDGA